MSRVNAIIAATCVASDMIMTPNIIIGVFMAPVDSGDNNEKVQLT